MITKLVGEDFDKEKWNKVATHPLQSWEWGEARKKMGVEVVRFGEFNGTALKNVFQMTLHHIPVLSKKTAYLPRSVFPSKNVLQFLTEYCEKNKIISVKFEPYEKKKQEKNNPRLIRSRNSIFPEWTIAIDLSKTEQELFKEMKPKTRYNIRLAQKKEVSVKEETTEKGFETLIKLYFETTKRQNYYGHSYQYHKAIFDSLKTNIIHILIAYYKNIPLAAYELFHFKKSLYYVYGGSSDRYRNLMANQLIMWEAIKLGKKIGAEYLDMWGSLEPDYKSTHPWAGFTRFKEGYGGNFVQFVGTFDLVVNKPLYKLFETLYMLRNNYLILKGRFR